ncbi:MAG TPA: glycosyltransferase family 2 protein [Burkholderiaceae bacterium]
MSAVPALDEELTRFVRVDETADLSVILVNYNTAHLLERCLRHLRAASRELAVRVVIVDNASRDGSAAFIRETFPDCILVANQTNVGFGRANNQALALCPGPYVLLLNVDAFMYPDALTNCLRHMAANPRCGVLGARLLNPTGQGFYTGRPFPRPWHDFLIQTGLRREPPPVMLPLDARPPSGDSWHCDWVVGCFYMVRREVVEQVGLFDDRYFLYFEEVDHCRAVRAAGWTVECLASAHAIHIGGASAESEGELTASGRQISELQIESELLYFRKHNGLAGLLLTVMLNLTTYAVQALKWILKGRPLAGLGEIWRNAAAVCRLTLQTRFGTRATR